MHGPLNRDDAIEIHRRIFPPTPLGEQGREILDTSLAEIAANHLMEFDPTRRARKGNIGSR